MRSQSIFNTSLNTEGAIKLGIIVSFVFVGLLIVAIAGLTFASSYSAYNNALAKYSSATTSTTTPTNNIFVTSSQTAMDTLKQLSSYYWTSDEVSRYAEKLSMYKPETMSLDQPSTANIVYPDGTSSDMSVRNIKFGAVMSMKAFEDMYRELETNKKFVSISSTNIDALTSYKEITITFFLHPIFAEPSTYPIKAADLYEFSSGLPDRQPNSIPVIIGHRFVWATFTKVQENILPTGLTPKAPELILIRP